MEEDGDVNLVLVSEDDDVDDRLRWTLDENPNTARRGTTVAFVIFTNGSRTKMPMHR